jgi:hypothetical protein
MDNCGRENKNQYVLSYLAYLVRQRMFSEVELSFLPVGHTHEDVDQMFSKFSSYFRSHNCLTINQMKEGLKKACSEIRTVIHLEEIAQFKQMTVLNKWIKTITGLI